MTVEIICVGTELLLGNIVNTNAAWLSEQCALLGLEMYYQTVIGDNPLRLKSQLLTSKKRSDIVILSGGLGPTEDDLTKEIACEVMGRQLVLDEQAKKDIEIYFRKLNRPLTDNNWKQAYVPEGCRVLYNKNGTAPGIIMSDEESTFVLLPGPPGELKPMFEDFVIPVLEHMSSKVIRSKMIKISGVGESRVETEILDLIDGQTNPTIATYAKTGEVHIRVTASADTKEAAYELMEPVICELRRRFGKNIYTEQESVTLEDAITEYCLKKGVTISTAESCSGGLLAGRLVNAAGVSAVLKEGFVTYSNEAKMRTIGVKQETLNAYGAVSEQTACEMAEGCAKAAGTDYGVSTTGIAGPDGGTPEKPVGLVYIGIYAKGSVKAYRYQFSGNRARVREQTVAMALRRLRNALLAGEES